MKPDINDQRFDICFVNLKLSMQENISDEFGRTCNGIENDFPRRIKQSIER